MLGIDPGLERTGYAIVDPAGAAPRLVEAGLIRLNPADPLPERLAELAEAIRHILDTRGLAAVACEALFAHYKHPRTAILMAHARGVILAETARAGLPILDVAATQVKKTLTGNGHASKAQVQRAVAGAFGLSQVLEPNDVADAAAIALCGLSKQRGQVPFLQDDSHLTGAAT